MSNKAKLNTNGLDQFYTNKDIAIHVIITY